MNKTPAVSLDCTWEIFLLGFIKNKRNILLGKDVSSTKKRKRNEPSSPDPNT
jgi:hypothetical protein